MDTSTPLMEVLDETLQPAHFHAVRELTPLRLYPADQARRSHALRHVSGPKAWVRQPSEKSMG